MSPSFLFTLFNVDDHDDDFSHGDKKPGGRALKYLIIAPFVFLFSIVFMIIGAYYLVKAQLSVEKVIRGIINHYTRSLRTFFWFVKKIYTMIIVRKEEAGMNSQ